MGNEQRREAWYGFLAMHSGQGDARRGWSIVSLQTDLS